VTAAPAVPGRVLVAGAGLIGTSVALALRERGAQVWLADADEATARLAADLGAAGHEAFAAQFTAARVTESYRQFFASVAR